MDKNYFQAFEIYFRGLEIYFSAFEIYFRATEKVLCRGTGNLCPWGGGIVSVAAEGAKRVIMSPEKEKMRSKCWESRGKVLTLYRLMRVCVRRHEV